MSAFVNDRDVLIQNTVPRYTVSVDAKEIRLTPSTPVFAVRADGTATIDAITITAELVGITGDVEFTVSPGAALTVDGLVATLRFAAMTADVAFVQAKVRDAESNLDFIRSTVISKVFSGPPGDNGKPGERGTKIIAVSGYSTWSDASAVAELAAAGFGAPINRDVVTLYGPLAEAAEFTMTKFYDGSAWIELGTYINGNLLVRGTVAAEALDVDRLSAIAADLGSITAGTLRAVTIHGGAGYPTPDYAWPTNGGMGYHLSELGLRIGNVALGKFFEVNAAGELYAPGLSIATGGAIFSGVLAGATGTFSGTLTAASIIAGRGQNADNTTFVDFNAVGSQAFLYAGGGAVRINADGSGVFARGVLTAPNIVAGGVAAIAPGQVGRVVDELRPFTVYIDTGKTFEDVWYSAPSATYIANATISGGTSANGGCNGYGESTVVVGDGLSSGGGLSPVDGRIYIRYTWTPVSGTGSINPTNLSWKLVQV